MILTTVRFFVWRTDLQGARVISSLCKCVLLVALFSCPASAIVIDDFASSPVELMRDDEPVTFIQPSLDPQQVVGGVRSIVLGEFGVPGQFVRIENSTVTLGLEQPGSGLAYLEILYGSDAGPLSIDLTADGNDRFVFNGIDPAALPLGWLRVGSESGESALSFRNLDTSPYLLFDDFTGGADFSNVSWIEIDVIRSSGFSFGSIHTVPEPYDCYAMVVSLVALSMHRRHRHRTVK